MRRNAMGVDGEWRYERGGEKVGKKMEGGEYRVGNNNVKPSKLLDRLLHNPHSIRFKPHILYQISSLPPRPPTPISPRTALIVTILTSNSSLSPFASASAAAALEP